MAHTIKIRQEHHQHLLRFRCFGRWHVPHGIHSSKVASLLVARTSWLVLCYKCFCINTIPVCNACIRMQLSTKNRKFMFVGHPQSLGKFHVAVDTHSSPCTDFCDISEMDVDRQNTLVQRSTYSDYPFRYIIATSPSTLHLAQSRLCFVVADCRLVLLVVA